MSKVDEAREILRALGLPRSQQHEMCALTLLVLAGLDAQTPWKDATASRLGIADPGGIIARIGERFERHYAMNTRESVRKNALHDFVLYGLARRNPDNPGLATNDKRTHYALADDLVDLLRVFGADDWPDRLESYRSTHHQSSSAKDTSRRRHLIPLKLSPDEELLLSPGPHNALQAAIHHGFAPRFAPGATLLYLGDAERKTLILRTEELASLGVTLSSHDKLPDLVYFDGARSRLVLVEAVYSTGPVSPKRLIELEAVFGGTGLTRIYVTAFPNLATFKQQIAEIAWETEVWLADVPDHLIHFNGERFLQGYGDSADAQT